MTIVSNDKMELTIIISYYKALDNLRVILQALNRQSVLNFEVILSEDDYNEETIDFVLQNAVKYKFPLIHLYQSEDKGFRKNEMLNRSILRSNTGKLIFIDGDCVPHKDFTRVYSSYVREGFIFEGRSVMLSESITHWTKKNHSLARLNFISILFSASEMKKEGIYFPFFSLSLKKGGRGLLGRNWGVSKKALLDINGFDMDYVHAGVGEDVDVEWRLKAMGLKTISMKNKAIVYHLYHPRGYSEDMVKANYHLMNEKQEDNNVFCLNGLGNVNSN